MASEIRDYNEVRAESEQKLTEMAGKIDNGVQAAKDGVASGIQAVGNAATAAKDGVVIGVKAAGEMTKDGAVALVNNAQEKISYVDLATESARDYVADKAVSAYETGKSAWSSLKNTVTAKAQEFGQGVVGAGINAFNAVDSFNTEVGNGVRGFVSKGLSGVADGLSGAAKGLDDKSVQASSYQASREQRLNKFFSEAVDISAQNAGAGYQMGN